MNYNEKFVPRKGLGTEGRNVELARKAPMGPSESKILIIDTVFQNKIMKTDVNFEKQVLGFYNSLLGVYTLRQSFRSW